MQANCVMMAVAQEQNPIDVLPLFAFFLPPLPFLLIHPSLHPPPAPSTMSVSSSKPAPSSSSSSSSVHLHRSGGAARSKSPLPVAARPSSSSRATKPAADKEVKDGPLANNASSIANNGQAKGNGKSSAGSVKVEGHRTRSSRPWMRSLLVHLLGLFAFLLVLVARDASLLRTAMDLFAPFADIPSFPFDEQQFAGFKVDVASLNVSLRSAGDLIRRSDCTSPRIIRPPWLAFNQGFDLECDKVAAYHHNLAAITRNSLLWPTLVARPSNSSFNFTYSALNVTIFIQLAGTSRCTSRFDSSKLTFDGLIRSGRAIKIPRGQSISCFNAPTSDSSLILLLRPIARVSRGQLVVEYIRRVSNLVGNSISNNLKPLNISSRLLDVTGYYSPSPAVDCVQLAFSQSIIPQDVADLMRDVVLPFAALGVKNESSWFAQAASRNPENEIFKEALPKLYNVLSTSTKSNGNGAKQCILSATFGILLGLDDAGRILQLCQTVVDNLLNSPIRNALASTLPDASPLAPLPFGIAPDHLNGLDVLVDYFTQAARRQASAD